MTACAPNCGCPCHAVPPVELLRLAGVDASRCSPRECELLAALLPVGSIHDPRDVAGRLFAGQDDPTHSFRTTLSRARRRLGDGKGDVVVSTGVGSIRLERGVPMRKPHTGGTWNRGVHPVDAARVLALHGCGLFQAEISRRTKIAQGTVSQIVRGDHWTQREGLVSCEGLVADG